MPRFVQEIHRAADHEPAGVQCGDGARAHLAASRFLRRRHLSTPLNLMGPAQLRQTVARLHANFRRRGGSGALPDLGRLASLQLRQLAAKFSR